ncbi:hypothetical protein HMI54_001466 [Coelomomyces lativittatus]|nr:hypothetical protein HMI56_000544 [Coelomomyces lativittatus]KAJ1510582.1 hypothetical protein HMI54_001466 [Coelomomyces lativittatus]
MRRSWTSHIPPPSSLKREDLIVLALSSHNYSLNPLTFQWGSATNREYSFLWRIIARLALNPTYSTLILPYIKGRSPQGYLESQNSLFLPRNSYTDVYEVLGESFSCEFEKCSEENSEDCPCEVLESRSVKPTIYNVLYSMLKSVR